MRKMMLAVIAAMAMAAAFAQGKNAIAVPAPKGVNLGDDADWIPLFIQGVITTNFQQYSGMTVIDRQNADMVKAEQKLSESAEFDEKNTIEIGKMTSARLTVTGNIVAKSNAYALTFNITEVESGETKASASIPNCSRSALEDSTAANQISYDLMTGYGIALSADAKTKLTQKASVMAAETSAQVSVAKGIAAEKGGSNIEALTYYIQARKSDNKLAEATSRMAGMSTVVAGGNFGANAKNLIKLRDDWEKLLKEAAGLIAANPPEFELRYFTDIEPLELTEENYNKGTMSFRVGAPYLKQTSGAENFTVASELMTALQKIEQSKNWGAKMNGFPWTYADDIAGDNWLKWANANKTETYPCTVTLLDANKKTIAKKPYTLNVKYDKKYTGLLYVSSNSFGSSLTIPDVPVSNADTDKIYISVENTGSKKISVLPLPSDCMPGDAALKVLKNGSHNGTVKIGGFMGKDYLRSIISTAGSGKKTIALDLAEVINVPGINNGMFKNCRSLKSITIPDGETTISKEAFYGCESLQSITIPDSVTTIGDSAFYECRSLQSITIPDGVTTIGNSAFCKCTSLQSITIPDGVTTIGDDTFTLCSSLKSITIPSSVTKIGDSAFYGCGFQSITIPDGVTTIGNSAFSQCGSLQSITIPDGVTTIGYSAFNYCKSLQSITIPSSVTTIGKSAFSDCKSLQSITIPSSVTTIGDSAFYYCSSLQSITIPSSVTTIGNSAFYRCESLKSITIPEGVTEIGKGAFSWCTSLTSVTIPKSVTKIGDKAFYECMSIKTINYTGTKEEWGRIKKDSGNSDALNKAKIKYNYKGK